MVEHALVASESDEFAKLWPKRGPPTHEPDHERVRELPAPDRVAALVKSLNHDLPPDDRGVRAMVEGLAAEHGLRLDYGFALCDGGEYDELRRDWGHDPPEVEGNLLGVYDQDTEKLVGMLLLLYGDSLVGYFGIKSGHGSANVTYARFLPVRGA